jgi:hypothetical protein
MFVCLCLCLCMYANTTDLTSLFTRCNDHKDPSPPLPSLHLKLMTIHLYTNPTHTFCILQGTGEDEEDVESSSATLVQTEDGFEPVFFEPRPLRNLALIDEMSSLMPITDMKVSILFSGRFRPQIFPPILPRNRPQIFKIINSTGSITSSSKFGRS